MNRLTPIKFFVKFWKSWFSYIFFYMLKQHALVYYHTYLSSYHKNLFHLIPSWDENIKISTLEEREITIWAFLEIITMEVVPVDDRAHSPPFSFMYFTTMNFVAWMIGYVVRSVLVYVMELLGRSFDFYIYLQLSIEIRRHFFFLRFLYDNRED